MSPMRMVSERRLEVQYEVSRLLAEADELGDVTPALLQALCTRLGWRTASIWAPDGPVIRCVGVWADSSELAAWQSVTRDASFLPGAGLPGRVWASGHPAWIADVATDMNFPRRDAARRARLRHGVAFPVPVDGRVEAVFECFGARVRRDNEGLIRFLEALGHQVGAFLKRAAVARALRVSEVRKTAILDAALDAIVTSDEQGRIVEFNRGAERLFGRVAADVVGRSVADVLVPPELHQTHVEGLSRYVETGVPRILGQRVRTTALRADRSRVAVELTVTEARLGGQRLFTAFIRDITAVHEAEVARERFLEILSHELRTPVTSIYGGAAMLARPTLPASSRETLTADIAAEADRLYRLIENLVVLARAERGARDVALEPVHLAAVVRRVIEGDRLAWGDRELRLHVPTGGSPVLGEETWIQQVLRNLLSNAAKYAAAGTTVEVIVEDEPHESTVRVLDDGPGVKADEVERLFDIEYRSPSMEQVASGSGIGLFVARWLVEGMGGRIWARARAEGGSEFGFSIPRIRDDDDVPPTGPIVIAAIDTRGNGPSASGPGIA